MPFENLLLLFAGRTVCILLETSDRNCACQTYFVFLYIKKYATSMVTYKVEKTKSIADDFSKMVQLRGNADLYVVETSWVEDGTVDISNRGGEALFYLDKESAMNSYNNILENVVVDDYSIFDISAACYNIRKDEMEFPLTDEKLSYLYAEHVDSNNEFISRRISGKRLAATS